jgi:hypothetical protein
LSARCLDPALSAHEEHRTAFCLPAVAIVLSLAVSGPCAAQTGTGRPEDQARDFSLLAAVAFQVPLAHLSGCEPADGFAQPDFGLILRGYLPLTGKVDLTFDLALPRFKVRTGKFILTNSIPIEDAEYFGKMLAVGARLFVGKPDWGKPYLVATGGMYQLNYDRFLSGFEVETRGAFRPGAAIGGGIRFKVADFTLDGDIRYHRFTDTGNYGLGDLSWIELAFGMDLQIGRK